MCIWGIKVMVEVGQLYLQIHDVPEQAAQWYTFVLFFCLDVRTFESHFSVHCFVMNLIPTLIIPV